MAEGLPPVEVGRAAAAATGRVFPPRLLGQPLRRRRRQRAQSRRSSGGGLWCAQASGLSARGDGLRAASVGAAPVRRFRRRPEQVIEEGREETASLASPRAASSRSEGRSTAAGELSGAFSSAWGSSGDGGGGGDAAFGDAAGDGSAGGDAADDDAAGGGEGGGGVGPSCRGAAGGAPGASGSDGRSHGTSYAGTHASVPSLKTHDSWCSAPSREREGSAHNTRAARPRGPTARPGRPPRRARRGRPDRRAARRSRRRTSRRLAAPPPRAPARARRGGGRPSRSRPVGRGSASGACSRLLCLLGGRVERLLRVLHLFAQQARGCQGCSRGCPHFLPVAQVASCSVMPTPPLDALSSSLMSSRMVASKRLISSSTSWA